MQFLLYAMLACNLLMGTFAYVNGDKPGVSHATTFGLVSVVALGTSWLSRRDPQ